MKRPYAIPLLFLCTGLFAVSIQFNNRTLFYGIGEASFSGYWVINSSINTFSGQDIGDFYPDTQLWLLHDALTIYHDEGDTLVDYDYRYRYYKIGAEPPDWQSLEPVMSPPQQHLSGYWYTCGYMDGAALFDLPLDTGDYFLEFQHIATVAGSDGDTLQNTYILPDSAEFKAEFSVLPLEKDGTEGSLPVTLTYFNAANSPEGVRLDWRTESETENSHFLVYRNGDVIARVEGHGTTTETHSYRYTDTQARAGVHSYAISDVTCGGVEDVHASIEVKVEATLTDVTFVLNKAYPNPFNPRTVISMHFAVGSNAAVNIYNTQGVQVDQLINGYVEAGTHELIWDAVNMPSGIYVVKMMVGDVMQSQKVVLMK